MGYCVEGQTEAHPGKEQHQKRCALHQGQTLVNKFLIDLYAYHSKIPRPYRPTNVAMKAVNASDCYWNEPQLQSEYLEHATAA